MTNAPPTRTTAPYLRRRPGRPEATAISPAETLVRQLVERVDLVRMILATPELAASLTARPVTLHHLASQPQAIEVLGSVLESIAREGTGMIAAAAPAAPTTTPLTERQLRINSAVLTSQREAVQPGFDQRRISDGAYRKSYLDLLYQSAELAQRELVELANRLAGSGAAQLGKPGWRTVPKDRQRTEDKAAKFSGDVSRITDLAAAKVEFRSLEGLYSALDDLRRDPSVRIVRCEDRFRRPQASGYRDVQLSLRTSNGHVAEFRLHLAAIDEVAEWEHVLYEVRRDLTALAAEAGRPISAGERALYNGLALESQRMFWRALSSSLREDC